MDDNKVEKLHSIGYKIRPCCGTCYWSQLGVDNWGTCGLHTYEHKKHVGGEKSAERELSICSYGLCDEYEADEQTMWTVVHYKEFIV